jgi:hypothetical protein
MKKSDNLAKTGVVIVLDFAQLKMEKCSGSDSPGTADSNYEVWTPNGRISPNCLLGKLSY